MDDKARESRARRAARRRGLDLHKVRRRDPRAIDFGGFYLVDPWTNTIVAGEPGSRALTLDEVEEALADG